MNKKQFKEVQTDNPDSKIWCREFPYQKARDRLARILKNDIKILETPARIDYLVEKTFSNELISKEDYDFVLWLSTKDLQKFHSKIKNRVLKYKHYLRERDNGDELPNDYGEYVYKFYVWNQMLRFISQMRNDVHSETFWVLDFRINQEKLESRTNQMKSIYPNREEMIAENKAETKEENIGDTSVAEKKVEGKKE